MEFMDKRLLEEVQFVEELMKQPGAGRQLVFQMVRANWKAYTTLHPKLRADKEVALCAIRQDWNAMQHVPKDDDGKNPFWSDEDVVAECVSQDWQAVNLMHEDLWENMKIIKAAIKCHAPAIYSAPNIIQRELWGDRDVVKMCVEYDKEMINKARPAMWDETDIVLEAVKQDYKIMEKAPRKKLKDLWSDYGIASECVRQNWECLSKVDADLQSDRKLVLLAMEQSWKAIELLNNGAQKTHWADRGIAMCAVKQDWKAFQHTDKELMDDRYVVLPAVRENYRCLEFVSKDQASRYWADQEVVIAALEQDAKKAIEMADKNLYGNRKVMLQAVTHYGAALRFGTDEVRAERYIVEAAVTQDGMALEFASEALRADRELAVLALQGSEGRAFDFLAEALQRDEELVELAGIE